MGIELQIPDSVAAKIQGLADDEGVTIDDYVASLLVQRAAVAEAHSHVAERAARGSKDGLLEILETAPDVEPEYKDRRA